MSKMEIVISRRRKLWSTVRTDTTLSLYKATAMLYQCLCIIANVPTNKTSSKIFAECHCKMFYIVEHVTYNINDKTDPTCLLNGPTLPTGTLQKILMKYKSRRKSRCWKGKAILTKAEQSVCLILAVKGRKSRWNVCAQFVLPPITQTTILTLNTSDNDL